MPNSEQILSQPYNSTIHHIICKILPLQQTIQRLSNELKCGLMLLETRLEPFKYTFIFEAGASSDLKS